MTDKDKQLLIEFDSGIIPIGTLLENFSVNLKADFDFIKKELRHSIDSNDPNEIEITIALIWASGQISAFLEELNELLINPNHKWHQVVAKALQDIASPSTVPYVRKALESNFDYLEYTCSNSDAIAKWFSWLLYAIGTPDAIELMEKYSHSSDSGIKKEMIYRLNKVYKKL